MQQLIFDSPILQMAVSCDGKYLALSHDFDSYETFLAVRNDFDIPDQPKISLLSINNGQDLATINLTGERPGTRLNFINRSPLLIYIIYEGIQLYDCQAKEILATIPFKDIAGQLKTSMGSRVVFYGGSEQTVQVWDVLKKERVWQLPGYESVYQDWTYFSSVADISSEGEKVAVIRTGNQNILIYEIETNALLHTIPHAPFAASEISWSLDTNYLAVIGEETKNEPYEPKRFVWSLKNQELIAQENLESPSNDCAAIAFHPSSNYLATGYTDGRIILESLKSKKTIFSDFIQRSKVESIVFTSDGKRMISGGEDRTVSIINLEELEQL
jgi:WD40 repeat protein